MNAQQAEKLEEKLVRITNLIEQVAAEFEDAKGSIDPETDDGDDYINYLDDQITYCDEAVSVLDSIKAQPYKGKEKGEDDED